MSLNCHIFWRKWPLAWGWKLLLKRLVGNNRHWWTVNVIEIIVGLSLQVSPSFTKNFSNFFQYLFFHISLIRGWLADRLWRCKNIIWRFIMIGNSRLVCRCKHIALAVFQFAQCQLVSLNIFPTGINIGQGGGNVAWFRKIRFWSRTK